MRNKLIYMMFALCLISIAMSMQVSAESGSLNDNYLGNFKVEQNIDLKIPCVAGGAPCPSSYRCNMTVLYPNSSYLIINRAMSMIGNNTYNITLPNTYTTGTYNNVVVYCTDGTLNATQDYVFDITPTGMTYSIAQSVTYVLLFFIILFIFCLALYGTFAVRWENPRDSEGFVVNISWKKYSKILLGALSYISLLGLVWFAWNIAFAFLYFEPLADFFGMLFKFLWILLIPVAPVTIILVIVKWVMDRKLEKEIRKGFQVQ